MSNQDNTDAILAALRRAGMLPTTLSVAPTVVPTLDKYWHLTVDMFDTFVDYRDASSEDEALAVAMQPLHPWYVHSRFGTESGVHICESNRNEYIEWLKRGVS